METRPQRISILHAFEPWDGGIPVFVARLSDFQSREGHQVHVLAPRRLDATLYQRFLSPPLEWRIDRRNPLSIALAERELHRAVTRLRPNVVHLHSFFAGLVGRLRRFPCPVVYQPNAWAFNKRGIGGWIALRSERWSARNTDLIATVSDDEADEGTRADIRARMAKTSTAVDLTHFRPVSPEEKPILRRRLGLPERPLALCIGRISTQKGQDQLVEEWDREIDHVEGSSLVLVGPGDQRQIRERVPHLVDRSVFLPGFQDDIREWIWASDVVVQPSRWEGMSIAVAEALACGTPVVATAATGMREAICDGAEPAGSVVPLGDMRALMAEISKRLNDPGVTANERVSARKRAEALFSVETVGRRVIEFYRSLMGVGTSRPQRLP